LLVIAGGWLDLIDRRMQPAKPWKKWSIRCYGRPSAPLTRTRTAGTDESRPTRPA